MKDRIPFEGFLLRASVLSGALLAASLALIAWGVSLEGGFGKTLTLTVATAVLSTSGISFVYEVFLSRKLAEEILALVDLEQRLAQTGIQEIDRKSKVDWHKFLADAKTVTYLPADPPAWIRDEWVHILDARLRDDVEICVYLPNPASPSLAALARRLSQDDAGLTRELQRILSKVETDWKQSLSRRLRRASIIVRTYDDGVPAIGFVTTDKKSLLFSNGLFLGQDAPRTLAIRFELSQDGAIEAWLKERLDEMASVGTHYAS